MSQKILKCDLHDYLEIACVYKIEVEFTFQDGSNLTGIPLTTSVSKDKKEYISFNTNDKRNVVLIPQLDLKSMQAIETTHHFKKVIFDFD